VFRAGLETLRQQREFVQYGGLSNAGRDTALADIRWLLATHGELGAWLWDPFLDGNDVLHTLFYCPHVGADLRALTSAKEAESSIESPAEVSAGARHFASTAQSPSGQPETGGEKDAFAWKETQAAAIEAGKGNCAGLTLEFRMRKGGAGWRFHDRFLIFPRETGGAIAWSLGTSINSLGNQHHILHKVSDGELIGQAFLALWEALANPEYLVWKKS